MKRVVSIPLSIPAQINVLADHVATVALMALRTAAYTTEFYPLPVCRVYLRDGTGYITSHENRTLTTESPEYERRAFIKKATIGPTKSSLVPSTGLPTDQPLLYSLIMSGPL
jgi:hypothetical protein